MKRLAGVFAVTALSAACFAQTPNTIGYWVAQSDIIPGYPTQMAGAAIVGEYLYILGGNNAVDGDNGRVWRLKIDPATGTLSDCTAMTTLPASNNFAYISEQVAATTSGLYVVGGGWNVSGPNRNNVCSIGVDSNGDFIGSAWSESPAMPGGYDPELGSAVIASNGYLYAMGGDSESGTPPIYDVCVYAPTSANGGLGSFSSGTTLPSPCYFSANAAVDDYIVLHRGLLTKGVNTSVSTNVYLAQVNSDGTMGSWVEQTGAPLPAGRYGVAMVAVNDTVFVLGGRASGGTPQNNVWRSQLSSGSLSAWQTSDASLPDGVRYHAAAYSPDSKSLYVVSIRRASDGAVSNEAYISAPLFPRTVSAAAADWSLFE